MYCPTGFVNSVDGPKRIKDGGWRSIVKNDSTYYDLFNVSNIRGCRYGDDAINMRETLIVFFNNEEAQVPWQTEYI